MRMEMTICGQSKLLPFSSYNCQRNVKRKVCFLQPQAVAIVLIDAKHQHLKFVPEKLYKGINY